MGDLVAYEGYRGQLRVVKWEDKVSMNLWEITYIVRRGRRWNWF
jgi:hypothetical protein